MSNSRKLGDLGEGASLDGFPWVNVYVGAVRLCADSICFYGYAGDLHVRLGARRSFDLSTNRCADVTLVLPAAVDEYRISLLADVVLVTHVNDCSSVRLHPGCGVRELRFLDGAICLTGALCRSFGVRSRRRARGFQHSIECAKMVSDRIGARTEVAQMNESKGFLMEIACSESRDVLYLASAAYTLGIPGLMRDVASVSAEPSAGVICLTRGACERPERIYVFGEGGIEFSDHRASAASICASLQADAPDASPTACVEALGIQAAAICMGPWMGEDAPPELGEHLADLNLVAGQVLEIEVTMNKPRLVLGAPQIELRIHGLTRLGRYVSGNGGSALRFVYEVLPADLQHFSSLSRGSAPGRGYGYDWHNSVEVVRLVLGNAVLLDVDAPVYMPVSPDAEIKAAEATQLPLVKECCPQAAQTGNLDVDLAALEAASGVLSVAVDVQGDIEYEWPPSLVAAARRAFRPSNLAAFG